MEAERDDLYKDMKWLVLISHIIIVSVLVIPRSYDSVGETFSDHSPMQLYVSD